MDSEAGRPEARFPGPSVVAPCRRSLWRRGASAAPPLTTSFLRCVRGDLMSLWQHADGSRGVAATQGEQVWPWNADATSFSVALEVGDPIAVKRVSVRR